MNIIGAHTLTQRAYALSKILAHEADELSYWLFHDAKEAGVAAELLSLFLGRKRAAHHLHFADDAASTRLNQLLAEQTGVWAISVEDFSKLAHALSYISTKRFMCRVGQLLNPIQVKRTLAGLGYGDEEQAYSVKSKGSVVQISTPQSAYRLVFGDHGVEQIFDESTQQPVTTIVCPPAAVDFADIPEKEVPIPRGRLIIDAVDRPHIQKLLPESKHDWISTVFSGTPMGGPKENHLFAFSPAPRFDKQFDELREAVSSWVSKKYEVHAYAIDPDVMATAFENAGIQASDASRRLQTVPMQGFVDDERKFVLLSHAEIFGRRTVAKRERRRDDSAFVTSLKVNDYVVHEDHGVARYLGLVTSSIEGHSRENMLLEYAKGDRLYVPVELAYKVDAYVGQAKPALQRLSGTSWIKLTRKASLDSQEFAKELLGIYARRSLIHVEPWHVYTEADSDMHQAFGYEETRDQEAAIKDVYQNLTRHEPMDRLVVGDVGFGKTEVAIRATYQAFLNKKQAVVLCPTTLLAQQHFDTFSERFKARGVRVEMLSRFTGKIGASKKSASDIIKEIGLGDVHIVIGTHRLLSKDVKFKDLGLIVVDEEQRFGVRHKERLKALRSQAHVLTLSATPIPRTLYFSLSGLRDISTIQTPPQGRQPIETSIEPYREERVKEVITRELQRGGQVFYLYNHVQTIHAAKRRLVEMLGKQVRIDIVHGQMPEDEMARVAEAFDHGAVDVLVCTTIIESGLDLPNVNTLVVEDATQFGLGQLYQIRGRIGRGKAKAYAYFMHPVDGVSGVAARRLQVLQEAKELGSGFQLAMRDLEMRGMGQLIGKRQHGHIQHVGLGMYGRLLRQAVEELESGHVLPPSRTTTISLPVDYGIPESLVPHPETRSRLYRQLSQAQTSEEASDLLRTWDKAIEGLKKEDQQRLRHLLDVLDIRRLCQNTRLLAIDYQERRKLDGTKKAMYVFEFEEIKPAHVEALVKITPDFRVVGQQIHVPAEDVPHPITFVKRVVHALQAI